MPDDLDAAWPSGRKSDIGQAAEFLVWASLIAQSGGGLHVFLPMLDRGIDAVVHRLEDGTYLALQVKGGTKLHSSELTINVYEKHLFTDDQLVLGVYLDNDHLGPYALLLDASTLKRKASRVVEDGRVMLVAGWPAHPIPGHKWTEDLVPLDGLAEKLGVVARHPVEAYPAPAVSDEYRVTGFWGEQEVCRRLAMLADCGLFRPFPDNETAELLLRRLLTGTTVGIQIKTCRLAEPMGRGEILALKSSFVAAPTTFVVALAWIVAERRFHENCLLIPSDVLPSIADFDGTHYELRFRPAGSDRRSRLDRYRVPLASLAETLARHL
jgi:hypothetical protein